eukprot:tig00021036_g17322.t1
MFIQKALSTRPGRRWLKFAAPELCGPCSHYNIINAISLRQAGEALAKAEQAVGAVASISDALLVADARGALLHSNAAFHRRFRAGRGPNPEAGPDPDPEPHVLSFFAPEDRPALAAFLARSAASAAAGAGAGAGAGGSSGGPGAPSAGGTLECTGLCSTQDGGRAACPVEVSAGRMEYGGRSLHILVLRDISRRKAAEAALVRSEERARVAGEDLRRILHTGERSHLIGFLLDSDARFKAFYWAFF